MFIKTVSTTSGINPIKFDETGGVFYWILNTGSSTVYASTKSTFTAGDDGVVSLGPKESRRLETNNDTIYILGEGQVEIHNQRDGICSFKQAPTSSGGGGTIDAYSKTESDAKYASKALYGDTTINVGRKTKTDVGEHSTAEGYNTTASGEGSHAEGIATQATGRDSHAEGAGSIASGSDSHAGGNSSIASGLVSFSHGIQTSAQSVAEVAFGKYNISRHNTLFSIGDGTANDARHNAFEITTDGGKLHDKDIATTDLIPTELPANGGNADTVDGHHADYFAKYDNPTIEGELFLVRAGNATTADSIFAWEDTLRLRNQDPNAENTTYTDLLLTPSGIFTEGMSNGNSISRKEISTTPIKKMTLPSVATNAGGGGGLFSADFGTPITIACTSRGDTQCTPFYYGDGNLWLLLAKDATTLDPIPVGTYSFDVWYI